MHIIDGDGGGSAIPFDFQEKSRMVAAASPFILKSLPLGSSPDAVRDTASFKDELLLAWTLSCSANRDYPGNCDWGYILPDGSVQRQSFRIDNASLQPESTTSQALSGMKEHEASAETQERSIGSRLFFGHRPASLKPESVGTGVSDEDVSGFHG